MSIRRGLRALLTDNRPAFDEHTYYPAGWPYPPVQAATALFAAQFESKREFRQSVYV